ncbi:hypothetical protein EV385_4543 [Krasilnikovia cinnamomea]|uniref:Uncharacterized protein n=1 Tax=Krasilnikovia cinnamomea TaxID=349313 RepID=A0A4Q7ZQD9_9ACTN|nr:hypothetical protein [Krasilnikovia cinnamomea]RZU52665.1 hypothetical protein EV385_4543 [Krasilnikovia cinnamomea]
MTDAPMYRNPSEIPELAATLKALRRCKPSARSRYLPMVIACPRCNGRIAAVYATEAGPVVVGYGAARTTETVVTEVSITSGDPFTWSEDRARARHRTEPRAQFVHELASRFVPDAHLQHGRRDVFTAECECATHSLPADQILQGLRSGRRRVMAINTLNPLSS